MSEYQYNEFQAIDRPLTEQDRQDLRAISARAQITATSFTNHYEWGDFKGEPDEFMERWFDLHLYLANWGTRWLMIRLPNGLIDQAQLERFIGEVDYARHWVAGEHLILDILFEDVGIDEEEDWREDTHWLSVLGGLRDDLLAGDLRMLYLLWMAAIEYDAFDEDLPEPMPGIGPMTVALVAFVNFFHIDPDVVAAAAERPATTIPRAITAESARAVISSLSDEGKIGLLIRVVEGDQNLAAKLRSDISRRLEPLRDVSKGEPRTVGELRARAVEIDQERPRK
ncbi:MAG: hypothetical protein ACR2OU_09930 [Thermomicrobiales bacterium]